MVKGVVGEEELLKLAEDRHSQSAVPTEALTPFANAFHCRISNCKLSSTLDRGFIFDLIPTPHHDSGEPACAITDTSRDDKRKGVQNVSWWHEGRRHSHLVKGVAEAAPILESDWDERLLVHICYSPRRWNCRNCTLSFNITSSGLRPCDFKMGKVLSSLQTYRCMYNFNLSGSICSFAYLKPKEPILQAVSEIMGYIIMSLRSRLDIRQMVTQDPVLILAGKKGCSLPLPRRVFAPWLAGVYACDYLQPSETVEVLKDHCSELLSMKALPDAWTILEPEKEAPSLVTKSFWDAAVPFPLSIQPLEEKSRSAGGGENPKPGHISIFAAIVIPLLSIPVGFVLFVLKG
ncbi:hypothetical protein L6164_015967 [Bauhinia variegata]|uniref:Uncharacterized protein n=1 Tax=Bauhinia variegata TaxID=167791 RepID=A0ACB9NP22_BAUVA|nr:hypothetical protein L6164_015967 [Bauhinia variegata]